MRHSFLLPLALLVLPIGASDSSADATGWWSRLPPPGARAAHSMIYEPAHDRLVVFGGLVNGVATNETWVLEFSPSESGMRWRRIFTDGDLPVPRIDHAAVYDPTRNQMIVIGGASGSRLNDVWTLALSENPPHWTHLQPSGPAPSPRSSHSAIFDRTRDRVVVFGGDTGTPQSDVWVLALSPTPTWSLLAPSGAIPPRAGHTAVYDRASDRMIVFGGSGLNDTWALSFGPSPAWTSLGPAPIPEGRTGHVAVWDPFYNRMIVFGGTGTCCEFSDRNDAFALTTGPSGAVWSQLRPTGLVPKERHDAAAVYDPIRQRMLVLGGSSPLGNYADLEALDLTPGAEAWAPEPAAPVTSTGHSAIYDPVGDAMVVYGDWASWGLDNLWLLDLTSGAWSSVPATPSSPPGLWAHSAVYDSQRRHMVVFGGLAGQVWDLDLGTQQWTELSLSGPHPADRFDHTAIYDPLGDRVILFGGQLGPSQYAADVWELRLGATPAWNDITPVTAGPSPRGLHTAIYDPVHHGMIVFGGYNGTYPDDLWELMLTDPPVWNPLATTGPRPAGRERPTAILDSNRQRMVMYGGLGNGGQSELWALPLTTPTTWQLLSPTSPTGPPPPGRDYHASIYDSQRDRMITFGGFLGNDLGDAWALEWGTALGVPSVLGPSTALELAILGPNPTRTAPLRASYTLPARGHVQVGVFDLAGRHVRTLAEGRNEPGPHPVQWDLRDGSGAQVGPGVYFIRAEFADQRVVRKTVVLR